MKSAKNESFDIRKNGDLRWLVLLVYFAIAFAIISYVWWFLFRHNSDLSTDSAVWGSFGDYFNGFVSPVVGFVTVVLIFRAYRTQEKEFSETTKSLKIQIEQNKVAVHREMLWKSAEEVYKEVYNDFCNDENKISNYLYGEKEEYIRLAKSMLKRKYVPRLYELKHYLNAIDELTDNDSRSTDFYRRRILNSFNGFSDESSELASVLGKIQPKMSWSDLDVPCEMEVESNSGMPD